MVKNPPCNVGDVALIPGQETKIPHATEQLNLRCNYWARVLQSSAPQPECPILQLRPNAAKYIHLKNYNEVLPQTGQNEHHKKFTNNRCWGGCVEKGMLLPCWECKLVQPQLKRIWRFRKKKLKIELPYDPAIPLLGISVEKTIIRKDTCTCVSTVTLVTMAKTWKQLNVHWQRNG